MKEKVICEKHNDCPAINKKDCYHFFSHYLCDNCYLTEDYDNSFENRCGNCISIKELRRLKLERLNERQDGL